MKRTISNPDLFCPICGDNDVPKEGQELHLNDWLDCIAGCGLCGQLVCSSCTITCYACWNDPDMENSDKYGFYCKTCWDKTKLVKVDCDYHTEYACTKFHSKPSKCMECAANENYDGKMDGFTSSSQHQTMKHTVTEDDVTPSQPLENSPIPNPTEIIEAFYKDEKQKRLDTRIEESVKRAVHGERSLGTDYYNFHESWTINPYEPFKYKVNCSAFNRDLVEYIEMKRKVQKGHT